MEDDDQVPEPVITTDLPPPADPSITPPEPTPGKKTVIVSTDVFAQIREEAKATGEKSAQAKLEARAHALGFASAEEMFTAAESTRKQPAPQGDETVTIKPATKPTPKPAPKAPAAPAAGAQAPDRRADRWKAEKERLQRVNAAEARKRKEAERTADALRAEITLREVAIRAGVTDVDYALMLVKRELAGKTQEELKTFDEVKFFAGLRETKPALFHVENRPGNTGPQGGPPPAPPKAPEITREDTANQPVDARKMTREQYQEHLRKRGIRTAS